MILPIYTVMKKMDRRVIEAAEDLGAPPRKVFAAWSSPLSLPGVVSGITMVFMPAVDDVRHLAPARQRHDLPHRRRH